MLHTLMIEPGSAAAMDNPAYYGPNYATASIWDYREGTSESIGHTNTLDRLAKLPPGLRFVCCPWGADERLDDKHNLDQSRRLAATVRRVFPGEAKPIDLLYYDNEGPRANYANINRLIAPAMAVAKQTCNFDDCRKGTGWWGKLFAGKIIGNCSCASSYDATDNTQMARLMHTIRANAPRYVQHLGPCRSNGVTEFGTPNVYARTRQVIMYAASHGVRRFVLAEYMYPTEYIGDMLACVSQCLADCDEVCG